MCDIKSITIIVSRFNIFLYLNQNFKNLSEYHTHILEGNLRGHNSDLKSPPPEIMTQKCLSPKYSAITIDSLLYFQHFFTFFNLKIYFTIIHI